MGYIPYVYIYMYIYISILLHRELASICERELASVGSRGLPWQCIIIMKINGILYIIMCIYICIYIYIYIQFYTYCFLYIYILIAHIALYSYISCIGCFYYWRATISAPGTRAKVVAI